MPYIKTRDGRDIYVKEWGKGDPVVLIHGWPLSADSWDAQALAIAESGYRVIAYDRRGFGRSEQPWEGYDYDTLANDLADVLSALDASSRITLVGFSMGGGEVARYMSKYQGQGVIKTVLVSSIVPYMLKTDDNPDGTPEETFKDIGDAVKEDRAKFFRHSFFPQFYGNGILSNQVSNDVIEHSTQMALLGGLRPTLACAEAFSHTDFRPDLASFTVPTLIIHGTIDKTVPIDASARAAAKGITHARLVEYDGAAHGLNVTHAKQLTSDLLKFLNE